MATKKKAAKKNQVKRAAKKSTSGIPLKPLRIAQAGPPAVAALAAAGACSLTTKARARRAIHAAIAARYGLAVTDATSLRAGGLGLDDVAIGTDLYATVVIAIHNSGCRLRTFSPQQCVACKTVGHIVNAVWADLNAA